MLADVHGNLAALEAVLGDARRNGATEFLLLGDVVGYGPEPGACVQRLAGLPNLTAIRGNHDQGIASGVLDTGMNTLARQCADFTRASLTAGQLAWLGELPIEIAGGGWLAVHGAPRDPLRYRAYVYEMTYEANLQWLRERGIPICFHGHSHVQLVHAATHDRLVKLRGPQRIVLDPNRCWLVNPGSVGQPRDGDARAAYAMWNRTTGELGLRRVAYDLEQTVRALHAVALPEALERRLRAGA